MGCIRTITTRSGGDLSVCTDREGGLLTVQLKLVAVEMKQAVITRVGGSLNVRAVRVGGSLTVSIALVCAVNQAKNHVRVLPEYIWLVPENHFTDIVVVESDVDWEAL